MLDKHEAKAMDFGLKILEMLSMNDQANFADYSELAHALLYPTCYDSIGSDSIASVLVGSVSAGSVEQEYTTVSVHDDCSVVGDEVKEMLRIWMKEWSHDAFEHLVNTPVSKISEEERKLREMYSLLGDSEFVLPMLRRQLEFVQLKQEQTLTANTLINLIASNYNSTENQHISVSWKSSISLELNFAVLNAFLSQQHFESVFEGCTELAMTYQNTSAPSVIARYIESRVMNALEAYLSHVHSQVEHISSSVANNTVTVSSTVDLVSAPTYSLLKIVKLLFSLVETNSFALFNNSLEHFSSLLSYIYHLFFLIVEITLRFY